MTILFIDDDPMQHKLLDQMLKQTDATIFHAMNAQEGVDLLKNKEINLLLSDIHMDGMDGLSLLSTLKKDRKLNQIPVVIVTGDTGSEQSKAAFDQGAVGFLNKPFNKDEILHLLMTFARFESINSNEQTGDEFLTRKKQKLTNSLIRDSLEKNFEKAMKNYMDGMNDIFDFTVFAFYRMTEPGNFKLTYETGELKFPGDYQEISTVLSGSFEEMFRTRQEILSNDLLRTSEKLLGAWANRYGLVSEVVLPYFKADDRAFVTGTGIDRARQSLGGFFWGMRNSLFSSAEIEIIRRLSTQANPILSSLEKKSLQRV